jgi:signal recognition particle subunit SRP54
MFSNLSDKLLATIDKLRKRGVLSEDDVNLALREVRIALLEADVALPVVKDFVEKVKVKAIGQEVLKSINPAQMVVKIVHDQLIESLSIGNEHPSKNILNLSFHKPCNILVAGLQGVGKTTSCIKIAKYIQDFYKKKVLLVSLDVYRPAAREQLYIGAKSIALQTLPIVEKESIRQILDRALDFSKVNNFDVVVFDTAGRTHTDEELMEELVIVKKITNPTEVILVADSMTGQDSVKLAQAYNDCIGLTGVMLTRVDGDSRGGAALSIGHITKCPIKFLGVGERFSDIEEFDPKRLADRILDMGDIVALVEKAKELADTEFEEKQFKKIKKGKFDLQDMAEHLEKMQKMGGFSNIISMIPGLAKIKDAMHNVDDKLLSRQLGIIRSMTVQERRDYKILNASRKRRIAKGSGVNVSDINKLLKQFQQMQILLKRLGSDPKGFLSSGGISSMFGRGLR